MIKEDLFEYDEAKLPNIDLSTAQKNRIRKSLFKNIKRFNENNYDLPIDNSLENLKKIKRQLGSKKDLTIHGVKHSNVLKELALQAVSKDCPLKENSIIYKNFFHIGNGMDARDSTHSVMYSAFYCYLYISENFLITYSFDAYYRLQHKHVIKLEDIKFVTISNRACDGRKLSRDNLIISLHSTFNDTVSTIYLVNNSNNKNDIEEVKNVLTSLGVSYSHKKFKLPLFYYIYYFFCIVLVILSFLDMV